MSTPSTVKDVARHASVSVATVSRVINGNCPVSDELKLRVQSAITALEFSPNTSAAQLRRNRGMPKRRTTNEVQNDSVQGTGKLRVEPEDRTTRRLEALKLENQQLKKLVHNLRTKLIALLNQCTPPLYEHTKGGVEAIDIHGHCAERAP